MKHESKLTLTEQQQKLWALIREINTRWYQGHPTELAAYFHPNVVFNSPDFKHQITGMENCIRTYIDFMKASAVLAYSESNPVIQVFDHTAIVTYDFEMKYAQNGQTLHEAGTDVLVFEKEGEAWSVIWRALSNLKNI